MHSKDEKGIANSIDSDQSLHCLPRPICWLVDFILNVPVNNFSVMLGQSHRFLGITSTFGE